MIHLQGLLYIQTALLVIFSLTITFLLIRQRKNNESQKDEILDRLTSLDQNFAKYFTGEFTAIKTELLAQEEQKLTEFINVTDEKLAKINELNEQSLSESKSIMET